MLLQLDNEHVVRTEFIAKIEESNGHAVITLDDGVTLLTVTGLSLRDVMGKIRDAGADREPVPVRVSP